MSSPQQREGVPLVSTEHKGLFNLLRPLYLMYCSLWYLPITIFQLVASFQFSPFLNIDDFKMEWFARFWAFFGPLSREGIAPAVMPLLQNHARGVCLDIGPGSGQWCYLLGRANNPDITKIYGVEPNKGLHAELRANAAKAGLEDIYEVIGCGAEELRTKAGMQKETIDTIITVHCLCSVPTPQLIINELYPMLKPGGQWLVFEHVKSELQGPFVAYYQKAINIVWPHLFNGCTLTRTTEQWLLNAGEWESNNLDPIPGEGEYDALPHIKGRMIKKK